MGLAPQEGGNTPAAPTSGTLPLKIGALLGWPLLVTILTQCLIQKFDTRADQFEVRIRALEEELLAVRRAPVGTQEELLALRRAPAALNEVQPAPLTFREAKQAQKAEAQKSERVHETSREDRVHRRNLKATDRQRRRRMLGLTSAGAGLTCFSFSGESSQFDMSGDYCRLNANNICRGCFVATEDTFDKVLEVFNCTAARYKAGPTVEEQVMVEITIVNADMDNILTIKGCSDTSCSPEDSIYTIGAGDSTLGYCYTSGTDRLHFPAADLRFGGTATNLSISGGDVTLGMGNTLDVSAGTLNLAPSQVPASSVGPGTFGPGRYNFDGSTITYTGIVEFATINGGLLDAVDIGLTNPRYAQFLELSANRITLSENGVIPAEKISGGIFGAGAYSFAGSTITDATIAGTLDASMATLVFADGQIPSSKVAWDQAAACGCNSSGNSSVSSGDFSVDEGNIVDISGTNLILSPSQIAAESIGPGKFGPGVYNFDGSTIAYTGHIDWANINAGTMESVDIGLVSPGYSKFIKSYIGELEVGTELDISNTTLLMGYAQVPTSSIAPGSFSAGAYNFSGSTLDVSGGTLDLAGSQIAAESIGPGTFGNGVYSFQGSTIGYASFTWADINGGTIDNTNIGVTTPGIGVFTDVVTESFSLTSGAIPASSIGAGTFQTGTYTFTGSTIWDATIENVSMTVGAGQTLDATGATLDLDAGQITADKVGPGTFSAGTYSFDGSTILNSGTISWAIIQGGTLDGVDVGLTTPGYAKFVSMETTDKLGVTFAVGNAVASAVTANAQSGTIWGSATLTADADEVITVTNSLVTAAAPVIVSAGPCGGNGDVVVLDVTPASGEFSLRLKNIGSGACANAANFHFFVTGNA